MSAALKSSKTSIADKAMNEAAGANVCADSKEPEKCRSNIKGELDRGQFDTSHSLRRMKNGDKLKLFLIPTPMIQT
jgi:hypothetical protein